MHTGALLLTIKIMMIRYSILSYIGSGSVHLRWHPLKCRIPNSQIKPTYQFKKNNSYSGKEWRVLERLEGHEDWITNLDAVILGDNLLVASGSQDSTIRLWRIAPPLQSQTGDTLGVKDTTVTYSNDLVFTVQLESVLCGHEDKVFRVNWNKSSAGLSLLSVSMDKTMIVWKEEEDGVWMEEAKVGEIGGNTIGMLGATWGSQGQILGYSFSGAFHLWKPSESGWTSGVVVSGHQGPIVDIAWEESGAYILSASVDQTTRCHALCNKSGAWHEVGRPQVHGYDMSCVAALPDFAFVSGAEEKVLRAFQV